MLMNSLWYGYLSMIVISNEQGKALCAWVRRNLVHHVCDVQSTLSKSYKISPRTSFEMTSRLEYRRDHTITIATNMSKIDGLAEKTGGRKNIYCQIYIQVKLHILASIYLRLRIVNRQLF